MSPRGDHDYLEKYAPLMQILSDQADLEEVSSEPGYTKAAGARYKTVRLQALVGYAEALAVDFDELKEALVERAVADAELAETLKHTEQTLLRSLRQIRLRVFLEQFVPAPKPSAHPGLFTRVCRRLGAGPRPLAETLTVMSDLRASLAS